MRLAKDPTSGFEARRFVRDWAAQELLPDATIDDLVLAVDELVTNAVLHGDEPIGLELRKAPDGAIRGEVYDGSPTAPIPNPAPDHCGGFGLHIVDSRTTRWGSDLRGAGKNVWFEIDAPTYR